MKYIVTINGKKYEVEVEKVKKEYVPISRNRNEDAPVASSTPKQPSQTAAAKELTQEKTKPKAGDTVVKSPMPGTIIDIKVSVGQSVKEGETLLILEAMKMENEIVSPATATVKEIAVTKGSSVNSNDVLVVLG